MKKLNVSDYNVTAMTAEGQQSLPYDVKDALITCLFHPSLKLTAREILIRNMIGTKIIQANGSVLLEDAEYDKLKSAFDRIEGFGRNEIELINRVFNAESVEINIA